MGKKKTTTKVTMKRTTKTKGKHKAGPMEHFKVLLSVSTLLGLAAMVLAWLIGRPSYTLLGEVGIVVFSCCLLLFYIAPAMNEHVFDIQTLIHTLLGRKHERRMQKKEIAVRTQELKITEEKNRGDHEIAKMQVVIEQQRTQIQALIAQAETTVKLGQHTIEQDRHRREEQAGLAAFDQSQYLFDPVSRQLYAPPRGNTTITEVANLALPPFEVQVPTFKEAWYKGLIHPEQPDALLCHQLLEDPQTRAVTGIRPVRGLLEDNCTILLTGESQSGKSTLMAWYGGQYAMMDALLCIVDPHLTHPKKSVARKLAPISEAFLTEPASDDPRELYRVYSLLKQEADLCKYKGDSRYDMRPIVLIVDEILALMLIAKTSTNDAVRKLYFDFAVFLCQMGTQYAKFGISGILASQYATKSEFKAKYKGNQVDFRDGCVNQTTFRLPGNQASALGRIDSRVKPFIPDLQTGHGYMALPGKGTIRMATGDLQANDLVLVAPCIRDNSKYHSSSFAVQEPPKSLLCSTKKSSMQSKKSALSGCTKNTKASSDVYAK